MITTHISSLELIWRTREGRRFDDGTSMTQREYLDFVIDGRSLGELLGLLPGPEPDSLPEGLIGCLSPDIDAASQDHLVWQLLLVNPSELETGRRMLYVCAECGDVGCGAITSVIDEDGDFYVWREFGLERNYELPDTPLVDLSGYEAVGPFRFDKRQYRAALTNWPPRG